MIITFFLKKVSEKDTFLIRYFRLLFLGFNSISSKGAGFTAVSFLVGAAFSASLLASSRVKAPT